MFGAVFPVRRDAREGVKPSTELRKAGGGNDVHYTPDHSGCFKCCIFRAQRSSQILIQTLYCITWQDLKAIHNYGVVLLCFGYGKGKLRHEMIQFTCSSL